MSYETGTEVTPKDLFDHIVAQLQATAFMGAGDEWELKYSYDGWSSSDAVNKRVIKSFLCPGPTGAGDFHVVLQILPSTGTNTTNWLFAAFEADPVPPNGGATWTDAGTWSSSSVSHTRGQTVLHSGLRYVCDVNHTSSGSNTPGTAGGAGIWYLINDTTWFGALTSPTNSHSIQYGKVWSGGPGDIPYWLFANKSRVMFVTKSDARYHFQYAGGYVRLGTAASTPLPTLLVGNDSTASATYLSVADAHNNFPLKASPTSQITASLHCPANRTATSQEIYAYPPGAHFPPSAPMGRNPAGNYPVVPVLLGFVDSTSGDRGIVGTMDGVNVTDSRDSVSENVISIGADDYLVIEDVFRGQSGHYLALKME